MPIAINSGTNRKPVSIALYPCAFWKNKDKKKILLYVAKPITKAAILFRLNSQDLNNDNGTNGAVILLSQRMNRIKAIKDMAKIVSKNNKEGD